MPFEEVITKDHFIEVLEALHADQTGLVKTLHEIQDVMDQWDWMHEGRASFDWDDDEYRLEFGRCMDAINRKIGEAFERRNAAHEICCHEYRHIRTGEKLAVQLRLEFEQEDYAEFLARTIRYSTVEAK